MIDKDAQLVILTDALTKIVDVAAIERKSAPTAAELLMRAGDIAAQALASAATYKDGWKTLIEALKGIGTFFKGVAALVMVVVSLVSMYNVERTRMALRRMSLFEPKGFHPKAFESGQ